MPEFLFLGLHDRVIASETSAAYSVSLSTPTNAFVFRNPRTSLQSKKGVLLHFLSTLLPNLWVVRRGTPGLQNVILDECGFPPQGLFSALSQDSPTAFPQSRNNLSDLEPFERQQDQANKASSFHRCPEMERGGRRKQCVSCSYYCYRPLSELELRRYPNHLRTTCWASL
jgi:hypothetical protein